MRPQRRRPPSKRLARNPRRFSLANHAAANDAPAQNRSVCPRPRERDRAHDPAGRARPTPGRRYANRNAKVIGRSAVRAVGTGAAHAPGKPSQDNWRADWQTAALISQLRQRLRQCPQQLHRVTAFGLGWKAGIFGQAMPDHGAAGSDEQTFGANQQVPQPRRSYKSGA